MSWEHGRELATISNGTTTWTNTYNADGLRTKRTNGTKTYEYIYRGDKLIQMTVGDDVLKFGYDASGSPMYLQFNNSRYFYATNLQGDVMALIHTSGTAVVEYTYDAWGNILTITGSMADTVGQINPLRYRGYVYDVETRLYYLQSRYYDPAVGRFINADALVSTGQGILGSNMFAYCGNNPVNNIDPHGKSEATALKETANWILGLLALLDGATPFVEIAVALIGTVIAGTAILNSAKDEAKDKAQSITDASTADPEAPALYYGVDLYGGQMRLVTGPMLFDDAANWARTTAFANVYPDRASWGLYTYKRNDALAMAIHLGSLPGPVSFDDIVRNHLPHFHTAGRDISGVYEPNFHVWYSV